MVGCEGAQCPHYWIRRSTTSLVRHTQTAMMSEVDVRRWRHCFICRGPSLRISETELPYRPYWATTEGAFGLCRAHWRMAARRVYYARVIRLRGIFEAISLYEPGRILRLEAIPNSRSTPSAGRKWRQLLFAKKRVSCLCGQDAVDVGHRIPSLAFRLSGVPAAESYFAENLEPVCRRCNVQWSDFCRPDFNLRLHRTRWRRLRAALSVAHERGIRVGVPSISPRWGYPGSPVFDVRRLTASEIITPAAYVVNEYCSRPMFLVPSEAVPVFRLAR